MKVTMSGRISLAEAMTKHRKMMMNKCPEQTLQVEIQSYLYIDDIIPGNNDVECKLLLVSNFISTWVNEAD